MRLPLTLALAFASLSLSAAPAQAQFLMRDSDEPSVTATASASVPVAAERALVYVALAARGEDPAAAVREVAELRGRVAAALAPLGIGAEAVVPWGYGFGADADPRMRPPPVPGTEAVTRIARQGLRVAVEDLDRLDGVVAALVDAGVDGIPMIHFDAAHTAEARRRATEQAVAEAREQAEAMARAAGGRLGHLMSLVAMPEPGIGSNPIERFLSYPSGPQQGVGLLGSDVTVRVIVYGIWRFHEH